MINISQEETEKALFYVRTRGAGFVDEEEVLKIIGIEEEKQKECKETGIKYDNPPTRLVNLPYFDNKDLNCLAELRHTRIIWRRIRKMFGRRKIILEGCKPGEIFIEEEDKDKDVDKNSRQRREQS